MAQLYTAWYTTSYNPCISVLYTHVVASPSDIRNYVIFGVTMHGHGKRKIIVKMVPKTRALYLAISQC